MNIHMWKQSAVRRKTSCTLTAHIPVFSSMYPTVSGQGLFRHKLFVTHSTQIRPWLVIMWMLSVITAISFSLYFTRTFTCIICTRSDTVSQTHWPDLTDLHRARQKVPILYNGTPILTPKFAPSHGGSEPPSTTWSLGPSQILNPDGISVGSAVFAGLTSVRRYYFAVWTFETLSELLFRLNTYMPINSI